MDINSLKDRLVQNGQEHLLKFWERLGNEEQSLLFKDLQAINYEEVNVYFKRCMSGLRQDGEKLDDALEPLPQELCGSVTRCSPEQLTKYREAGLKQVSDGKMAVLLLAGGQGTRLGVSYPKGMYNVGLPSQKTLYQLQAERILKLEELAKQLTGNSGHIPWYIMTSEATREPTLAFFKKNNYFGLLKENVILFEQHTLPCLTLDGKIILEKMHKVARAPDGNGGLYRALGTSNVIEDMEQRGIQSVHVYCVDNILVKMADPVFVGFCMDKGAVCGAKVVQKAFPNEAVGVVCKVAGRGYKVVEYSEITSNTAERRNPDGSLTFNAGNICNHFFSVEFLKSIVREHDNDLIHHVAKKKITYVDEKGTIVKPLSPNGIKMEKFVFDVFAFSNNLAVWEVIREDEFSPLKNSDDAPKDTPSTSRQSLYGQHQHFVENAGGKFIYADGTPITSIQSDQSKRIKTNGHCNGPVTNGVIGSEDCHGEVVVEISPLVSYAGEALEDLVKGKSFVPPLTITRDSKGQVQIQSKTAPIDI